jgi:excisionase family DNA binding protein
MRAVGVRGGSNSAGRGNQQPSQCSSRLASAHAARFLTRKQVAEELNISMAQCYALIRRGEMRAAKMGGICWSRWRRRGFAEDPAAVATPTQAGSGRSR